MYYKKETIETEKPMNTTMQGSSLNYYHKPFPTLYYI